MGTRLDKLNEINGIANDLHFSLGSRLKLLAGSYLERLRARIPLIPKPVLQIRFEYEGRAVNYHMRCNDLDFQHLGSVFVRHEYNVPGKPKRILDSWEEYRSRRHLFSLLLPGRRNHIGRAPSRESRDSANELGVKWDSGPDHCRGGLQSAGRSALLCRPSGLLEPGVAARKWGAITSP
jgi:hypothetical protein